MAGDIHLRERAIVLPTGVVAGSAQRALEGATGRILHRYGERVMIAAVPEGVEVSLSHALPGAELGSATDGIGASVMSRLQPVERFGLEALALRQSDTYARAKQSRKHDNRAWDSGVASVPGCLLDGTRGVHAMAESGALTSARLTGTVAVGIIIVEGPAASLKFSATERTQVVAEVQNGLGWLASQSPGGVSFSYDIRVVTLNVAADPSLGDDQKEALWRDPAMQQLGYGSGLGGVMSYVEDLRSRLGTTWGYCAFFTKYPLWHFGYASIGGPRLVMDYANDGWGPDNIDRVFAHETGHIFGAPDEYASSGCNCGGAWGYHGKPNGNCAKCASGGGVECIMKQNSWAMCPFTPYHLGFPLVEQVGFPLVEQAYSGIWRQGNDNHYLWVNATWESFKAKWEELALKNLRLVDIEITGAPGADRFSGVFREGGGSHYLWVNATWESFKAKWEELALKNLRLVDIDVRVSGARLLYSGVWLPGNDGHYLWVNASWSSFKAKWEELAGNDLRLNDMKIVRVGGDTRYFGVWRQGTGGHYLWVNASWQSFKAKWEELAKNNLRLVDLEVTNFDGTPRYSGVWLPGSDAFYLWAGADWQSFRAKWEELANQGLRLVDLEVLSPEDESAAPERAQGVFSFGGMADESAAPAAAAGAGAHVPELQGDGGGQLIGPAQVGVLAASDMGYGGGEVNLEAIPRRPEEVGVDGEGGGSLERQPTPRGLEGVGRYTTSAGEPRAADGFGGGQPVLS